MDFLFDSGLAPLTNCMGFVESKIEISQNMYLDWISPYYNSTEEYVNIIESGASFNELLKTLIPLKYPEKRLLFSTKSGWTGYLENVIRTETGRIRRISERANCRSIEVGAWPSDFGKKVNGWGGGFFSLNQGNNLLRHIMLSNQDRGWKLNLYGDKLPFEETEKYSERFARNRFTPEMLDRYLKHYGIDFFNEDFYMPTGSKAYIIEIVRPPHPNEKPETLEEVRRRLKYE